MQKTGTLKVVASTGGLKFFDPDTWMNPANKNIKAEDLDYLKSMLKKKVVIEFNDKGKYTSCKLDTANNREIKTYPSTGTKCEPEQAKTGYVSKDTSIVRQTCLKASAEIAKSNMFPMPEVGYKTIDHLSTDILIMAEKFEEWVNRK